MTAINRTGGPRTERCQVCEDAQATLGVEMQTFNYGPVENGVLLQADVPVWTCAGCGERYLDADAEDARHAAVCAYLGRITPAEVKAIRVSFGMLQEDFAGLSGYGTASIKRWEAGSQIQSESVDKHLRLLRSLGIGEVVKRTAAPRRPEFRTQISAGARDRARHFHLRTPSQQPEAMAA